MGPGPMVRNCLAASAEGMETVVVAGLSITEIRDHESDAADFAALVAIHQVVERELVPGDPPVTAPELKAFIFWPWAHKELRTWLARAAGQAVGVLTIEISLDANRGEVRPEVIVTPDARRRGVATALLCAGLEATAVGRTRVAASVQTEAGAELSRALGLTHRQTERCSRLSVSDVDFDQQRRWIDEAPARRHGYEVVSWRGPCPERYLDAYCTATDAMADAPLDDFIHDHAPTTGQSIRDEEHALSDTYRPYASLALGPQGEPAGMTALWANTARPEFGQQDDTAVLADHRGLRLGRWLKAANLRQALDGESGLRTIETSNASSNPWMLAINNDMGFRPFKDYMAFQGPLDDALAALSGGIGSGADL